MSLSLALRDYPRRHPFAFSDPNTSSHAHGNESCNQSDKKLFHLTSELERQSCHAMRIVHAPTIILLDQTTDTLKRFECCRFTT